MNTINLKGIITDIEPSHTIQNIDFSRAHLIVPRASGGEDLLNLRFKKFSNPYENNQEVSLIGNVRSYSTRLPTGGNRVELYVFTYFDQPDLNEKDQEDVNKLEVDGRICKIESLRKCKNGKQNIHFIIANNMIVSDGKKKLNSYIPCIAWGQQAQAISKLSVNTPIRVTGKLHSREYKKSFADGTFEFRVAHECIVEEFTIL